MEEVGEGWGEFMGVSFLSDAVRGVRVKSVRSDYLTSLYSWLGLLAGRGGVSHQQTPWSRAGGRMWQGQSQEELRVISAKFMRISGLRSGYSVLR
jgi:hypothetical protein